MAENNNPPKLFLPSRRQVLMGGALIGAAAIASRPGRAFADTPKQGGTLRVAYVGGGSGETLDPNLYVATIDHARGAQLYDKLARMGPDLKVELELAETMEPNATADAWTVRLRKGVKWHDGSSLTVEDLLFTIDRIAAADSPSPGATSLRIIETKKAKKIDDLTVELPLQRPFANLPALFVDFWMVILKNGTKDFNQPIGTGPFKFKTFTAGQQSIFVRNSEYWRDNEPHVDQLEMMSIPDSAARLNALVAGQVDAIEGLTFTQAKIEQTAGRINVVVGEGPINTPMVMSVASAPFNDVRVRQAMRLLIDRKQLIDSVQLGYGTIGNDLYGRGLPFYADAIPQREADPDQAKHLLKAAGAENLALTLTTSTVAQSMLESALIFSQQASAAGINLTLDQKPADSYWSDGYMKTSFFQTVWLSSPIETWMQQALFKGSVWNESGWDDPDFEKRVMQAQATLDPSSAAAQWTDLQKELYDTGAYIFWGFYPWLDGVSKSVRGVKPSGFLQLGAHTFREWWLDA